MQLLLLPLLGAILTFFSKGNTARYVALIITAFQIILNGMFLLNFDTATTNHLMNIKWMPELGANLLIGFDSISMLFVILTNLIAFIIIYSSHRNENDRAGLFYGLILLMQSALIGVFISLNGFVFYVFWELALIPIYLICGIWGEGENRMKTTIKFFIYTFAGSLLMLVSFLLIYFNTSTGSFDWEQMRGVILSPGMSFLAFIGFFVAFAIKLPIFPFHTWQPDTYTMAPYQGTSLLSGIMLKMGVYGVIRWMVPLTPMMTGHYKVILVILCIIGVVYAGIIAIRQSDIKRIVAYSSFSHVGLIAAGAIIASEMGTQGALLQSFCHGINIFGLFYCIDIIQRRTGTRDINALGGIASSAPRFAVLFMIIVLGSVAVPLTNGFVGEFLLLRAVFEFNYFWALIGGLTIIFCAVYMLRIYQLAIFGEVKEATKNFEDVKDFELFTLVFIAFLVILLGLYPNLILDFTQPAVLKILN
jgi:NADH-quinone oxidoreductase subunit M